MSFSKLHSQIIHSSIWMEKHHVVRLWITILAIKDLDGMVRGSKYAIAHTAHLTREEADEAFERLESPDEMSSSREEDGRRIVRVDGGWFVVNHEKYKNLSPPESKREQAKIRQQRYRDKRDVTRNVTHVTPVEESREEKRRVDESRGDQTRAEEMRTPRAKRARRKLAPIGDWAPSLAHAAQADELGIDLQREAQTMRDWALSNDARKADWDATFRNWLTRKSQEPRRGPIQNAVRSTHRQLFPDMYEPKETP